MTENEDADKKIPETSKFIETHEVNGLTGINLNPRMANASRNLGNDNANR